MTRAGVRSSARRSSARGWSARRWPASAVLIGLLAATTACTGSGSTPASSGSAASASGTPASGTSASASTAPYPAVLPKQANRIVEVDRNAISEALTGADIGKAGARITGPAKEVLSARITVAKATKVSADGAAPLTVARLIAPTAADWPRWFLVGGSAEGLPTPALQVFVSASAREPYALWGQLSLLPGATLPDIPQTAAGAQPVAADASDLVMAPGDVPAHYADLLNRGDQSDYAKSFSKDTFRAQVDKRLVADRASVIQTGLGDLQDNHSADRGGVYAVRLADGGALVVALVRQTYVAKVTPGRGSVTVDPGLAALAGKATFTSTLTRTAVEVLAFQVPPKGSSDPVRLIAASKDDVGASGS